MADGRLAPEGFIKLLRIEGRLGVDGLELAKAIINIGLVQTRRGEVFLLGDPGGYARGLNRVDVGIRRAEGRLGEEARRLCVCQGGRRGRGRWQGIAAAAVGSAATATPAAGGERHRQAKRHRRHSGANFKQHLYYPRRYSDKHATSALRTPAAVDKLRRFEASKTRDYFV